MSYTLINNVKYDRKLIELENNTKQKTAFKLESVNTILHSCKDAGKFTKIELTSINYINDNYAFDYDTKQL